MERRENKPTSCIHISHYIYFLTISVKDNPPATVSQKSACSLINLKNKRNEKNEKKKYRMKINMKMQSDDGSKEK